MRLLSDTVYCSSFPLTCPNSKRVDANGKELETAEIVMATSNREKERPSVISHLSIAFACSVEIPKIDIAIAITL